MKTLEYKCCFCGSQGLVSYEEPESVSKQSISRLVDVIPQKIACDACAAFTRSKRDLERSIIQKAIKWQQTPFGVRPDLEQDSKSKIGRLLTALCHAYEHRYYKPPMFENQMVEMVMESVDMAQKALRQIYRAGTL